MPAQPVAERVDTGWTVVEEHFDPARQRAQETVFSVGNGRFATRGSLEEGNRSNRPATLAHGIYAPHPLAHSELANLPDWTALDVHVDGERFSLDSGEVVHHVRTLDLRRGLLRRDVEWRSPAGQLVNLRFDASRLLLDRASPRSVFASLPATSTARSAVHARLNARPETDGLAHTQSEAQSVVGDVAALSVRIRGRETRVAAAMRLRAAGASTEYEIWNAHEQPTLVAHWTARTGESAWFEKTVALVTTRDDEDPLAAAIDESNEPLTWISTGYSRSRRLEWASDRSVADIVIDGDPEAQLATRFALFQLLISTPRGDDQASIGAKGLTGFGYRGHVFWDTETFMLPFLVHFRPEVARNCSPIGFTGLPVPAARPQPMDYTARSSRGRAPRPATR